MGYGVKLGFRVLGFTLTLDPKSEPGQMGFPAPRLFCCNNNEDNCFAAARELGT
jgi:hypothetical protein